MSTLALSPSAGSGLSAAAARILDLFRAEPMRWIVLPHASRIAGEISPEEFSQAIEELESADLVERAPYGPLLYIR